MGRRGFHTEAAKAVDHQSMETRRKNWKGTLDKCALASVVNFIEVLVNPFLQDWEAYGNKLGKIRKTMGKIAKAQRNFSDKVDHVIKVSETEKRFYLHNTPKCHVL